MRSSRRAKPFLALLCLASKTIALTYDYVIVGGGTAGLVMANRLSENGTHSVLIVEAGPSVLNNADVYNPDGYGAAFGTYVDWAFKTVAQTYADGKTHILRAGKALGGTSTINGMSYVRAQAAQIDAWQSAGNTGWTWSSLWPYYLKSETFQLPTAAQTSDGHVTYSSADHGFSGPLKVGWAYSQANSTFPVLLNQTFQALNLSWNPDTNGGDERGFSVYPLTVDRANDVREDAARAYYYPYSSRSNLHALVNTTATRIIWKKGTTTASGVQVTYANGTSSTIGASKEVILSAGALVSPLLLELSGIGSPTILNKYGISVVVNLPGVGENLQDQVNNGLGYAINGSYTVTGAKTFVAYPTISQLFPNDTSTYQQYTSSIKSSLSAYASQVASRNNNATSAADLLSFFNMQYDLLVNSHVPAAEIIFYTSGSTFQSQYWSLLPFSRGSVHITSKDTLANAAIDPQYFSFSKDVDAQVYVGEFNRKAFNTAPLSGTAGAEQSPGASTTTTAQWSSWVKKRFRPNYHVMTSAAMLPRSKGGVVDTAGKVYGTTNVRVVDASIIPFQVCGHLSSTIYAVAERIADLMKQGK